MRAPVVLVLALAAALSASAARAAPPMRAARRAGPVAVDGRLDEEAWRAAEPVEGFVELSPAAGDAPAQRSRVRVLFDDDTLYVGVRCDDDDAARIVRPLGRRDAPAPSDAIRVVLDAHHDHRTGAVFSVTAGGVLSDGLVYDDDRVTYEWDAVWDGAAAVDETGWSAELAIPLAALGRPRDGEAVLGFGVVRELARAHETSATFLVPQGGRGFASRLGDLGGVERRPPRLDLEVSPYVATRVVARPRQAGEAARPAPRLVDSMLDLGLDARARLGPLRAALAVNPDFGQAEADRLMVNLTTFEAFFPEKRPFFTEGLDVFQPVGAGHELVPQQLFYSRRIGLETPILAAAKLVGGAGGRLEIGILDALVAGTGQRDGASDEAPDRGLRWSPAQPLRLAPGDAYPLGAPAPENHLAAVVRFSPVQRATLGLQATSALPLASPCDEEDAARSGPDRPAACDTRGANAVAADFTASTASGWYAYGQLAASRAEGGPPARSLRDGTVLRRGDLGTGAYLRAGKRAGEPWRLDLAWSSASPTLELNASGFQRTQNEEEGQARLAYVRPRGAGPLRSWRASVKAFARRSTDGRGLARGEGVVAEAGGELARPYLDGSCRARLEDPQHDLREIAGTGIPLRRPAFAVADCEVSTDPARPIYAELSGWARKSLAPRPLDAPWSLGAGMALGWRPQARLQTRLALALDDDRLPLRFVGEDGAGGLLFAAQHAPSASLSLRQLVALRRRVTLQVEAQLLTAFEDYGPFFVATARGTAPVGVADLRPGAPAADVDGRSATLVANAVLRWDARPGSTLYVVYARTQERAPGEPTASLAPGGLGGGPTTDSVLVKWSYRVGG